ncbi:MAG: cation diffusion facilitator family transporter [Azospirillum sp.]|nr:cation diffusion facilitator family transporter [Azospirillum sp.]
MDETVETRNARLRQWATYGSVAVASTLIATKLGAYLLTASVSLLSSLIDSSTDLMASVVTLLGVRTALKPPDRSHRFGHGKAEGLAALAQSAFVSGSAVFLVIEAIGRLVNPLPIQESAAGVAVMVLSMVLTAALITFQRHVVRTTGSIAIGADRLHYSGDLLMNGAVITSLLVTQATDIVQIDSAFALAIAAFLIWGAYGIACGALDVLMDRELPQEERDRVKRIVLDHAESRGLHDLRTRHSGNGRFIELHLELDGGLTLEHSHDIADQIERRLVEAFPDAEVLIHQEPAGLDDERLDHRIAAASAG